MAEIINKIKEYLETQNIQIDDIATEDGEIELGVQISIVELETEYYVALSHTKANMAFGVDKKQAEKDPDLATCLNIYSDSYKGL